MRKTNSTIENIITEPKALREANGPKLKAMTELSSGNKRTVASGRPPSLSRRAFLKLMGASSVMAASACRRPVEQIVPAVIRSPEVQPGIPTFYSTVDADGAGLIVRTRDGRPVKLAGNPEHPLSKGGLTAFQTASLMDLYDPDRLRRSALIDKRTGRKKYRKEEGIVRTSREKLAKGNYLLLTGPIHGPSSRALIQSFLKKHKGGRHVEFCPDPTLRQIAEGQQASYGKGALLPLYRMDRADLIVSIDADFLGAMPLSSMYAQLYSRGRELRKGKLSSRTRVPSMNRLVVFESMYTLTGSNADERFAIRPGDQTLIALALAAHIVVSMGKSSYARSPVVRAQLRDYLPSHISKALQQESGLYKKGYFESVIGKFGADLWRHRGRSLVLGGSPLAANGSNGHAQIALNFLNSILGNDGKTIDHKQNLQLSLGVKDLEMQSLVADLSASKIDTLIFHNANLLYHLPPSLGVARALKKTKYILSLNDRIDETGRQAHAILSTSHFLESWGDSQLLGELRSIQQPVIRPLYQTMSFEDRLIQLSGGELDGHKSFHDFIKARWQLGYGKSGRNFNKSWVKWLQDGYHAIRTPVLRKRGTVARRFIQSNLQGLPRFRKESWNKAKKNKLYLGLYYNIQVRDGSQANNAYRQELPDPITKVVWDNYVCLLPQTARELGLKQGSLVDVLGDSGTNKKITLPVHLQPGLHPQAALVALGYGRTSAGKVANGVGQNAMALVKIGSDSLAFSGTLAEIKKTGANYQLATTQAIYGHGTDDEEKAFFTPEGVHELPYRGSSQHDRPILRQTSYEEFKTGKFQMKPDAVEYPKKQELDKGWSYEEARWHMVIDLNVCTGCNACVTSCNTENNIPMVGKEEVQVGREMHWLRIDRYFEGAEEEASVAHQPMLCQHCENAPCESVCPVAATTHNSEGLNVMTYNRCIGTRYCANNCPYKVRRFNWFENWNYWEGFERESRDPQHLALNPDVTVRSRGVMEKCTFCVQRVAAARQDAQVNHRENKTSAHIPDGTVRTACQEVCPTQAISFGSILDPKSEVAQLNQKEKRAYKVLDFLGVKPQVTYLAKVRNKETEK